MQRIIEDVISLVNLYGIVEKAECMTPEVDLESLERTIRENEIILDEHFVHVEADYFVHQAIVDAGIRDALAKEQAKHPKFIPDEATLLKYKDPLYFESFQPYQDLLRFIKQYLPEERAISLADELYLNCEATDDSAMIYRHLENEVSSFKGEAEKREAKALIKSLEENTRKWKYNGFTKLELEERAQEADQIATEPELLTSKKVRETKRKIGRNEPCPCGSGKKYKKCCLA